MKILDVRNTTNHPYSLLYSEIYDALLLNASIIDGRVNKGFLLSNNSPIFLAAIKCLSEGKSEEDYFELIYQELKDYYSRSISLNAAHWLDLNFEKNHVFWTLPPWASVFPWRARTIDSFKNAFELATSKENALVGYSNLNINSGWQFCGPVSVDKIKVETLRILNLIIEIKKNGYQRNDNLDGDVLAAALVIDEKNWKWQISHGNHRAAIAAALGIEKLPIRVNLVINRQHAEFWPHVVSGLYTKKQALECFDNVYSGIVNF